MLEKLIVSRHPAAIAFIRAELGDDWSDVPVLASATVADVTGKIVAGNLPLFLASAATLVLAVEFSGEPPRGAEYGVEEMRAAGARISAYRVSGAEIPAEEAH